MRDVGQTGRCREYKERRRQIERAQGHCRMQQGDEAAACKVCSARHLDGHSGDERAAQRLTEI